MQNLAGKNYYNFSYGKLSSKQKEIPNGFEEIKETDLKSKMDKVELIDLRNKNISGKDAENALVKAEITVNKNMVPFDDKSPFVTSGIRIGTPAITTRGLLEEDMETIVEFIDRVLMNHTNEAVIEQVAEEVNEMMSERALFVF